MSVRNKEKRRAKRAARGKAGRPGGRTTQSFAGRSGEPWDRLHAGAQLRRAAVREAAHRAVHSECSGRNDGDKWVAELVGARFGHGGRHMVAEVLRAGMVASAALMLDDGWEPVDLWQAVRRQEGGPAAAALAGVLREAAGTAVDQARAAARMDQCAELQPALELDGEGPGWDGAVRAAVNCLRSVAHLPPLEDLGALGESFLTSGDRADAELLAKIRAMLAKAESTDFPEEAESFTLKATELMTRHRIDKALVEAEGKASGGAGVAARRCWIDAPYVKPKTLLLNAVATANACRAVACPLDFVTLVGRHEDLELTEMLFTSLLVQATRQMTLVGDSASSAVGQGSLLGPLFAKRKRQPSFRRSFLVAYASRIGTRLQEMASSTTDQAASELGGAFLPVLARQQGAVDAAVDKIFGKLEHLSVSVTSNEGWAAGTAAADVADLNVRQEMAAASR